MTCRSFGVGQFSDENWGIGICENETKSDNESRGEEHHDCERIKWLVIHALWPRTDGEHGGEANLQCTEEPWIMPPIAIIKDPRNMPFFLPWRSPTMLMNGVAQMAPRGIMALRIPRRELRGLPKSAEPISQYLVYLYTFKGVTNNCPKREPIAAHSSSYCRSQV
jgi:hypothetical protein